MDFEWGNEDHRYLPLSLFALRGETIEIYLLDADANLDGPPRLLGSIPSSALVVDARGAFIDIELVTSSTPTEACAPSIYVELRLTD